MQFQTLQRPEIRGNAQNTGIVEHLESEWKHKILVD